MSHFTGSDMTQLQIRAYEAYNGGRTEEAAELARMAYEAYKQYYGEHHSLTETAAKNLELFLRKT